MKEPTKLARVYESDHEYLAKRAHEEDTTIARIIHLLVSPRNTPKS